MKLLKQQNKTWPLQDDRQETQYIMIEKLQVPFY